MIYVILKLFFNSLIIYGQTINFTTVVASVAAQVVEGHVLDVWPTTVPHETGAKLMAADVIGGLH
jgi:hypothetical protein